MAMNSGNRQFAQTSFRVLAGAGFLLVGMSIAGIVQAVNVGFRMIREAGDTAACGCSSVIHTSSGTLWTVIGLGVVSFAILMSMSVRFLVSVHRARRFTRQFSVLPISEQLRSASRQARIEGRVQEIDGTATDVFCSGFVAPQLYVSSCAVRTLSPRELLSVLEHERCHLNHRDPLRLALANMIGGLLRFLPGGRAFLREYAMSVELAADEEAVLRSDTETLGSALLKFLPSKARSETGVVTFFGTTDRRIDQLLGVGRPRLPRKHVALLGIVVVSLMIAAGSAGARVSRVAHDVQVSIGQCQDHRSLCTDPFHRPSSDMSVPMPFSTKVQ